MNTVFVGGSRRLGRLSSAVQVRLGKMVERGLRVIIGDANGSDRAVQEFLAARHHDDVVIYCMESGCRNNVGGWPVNTVQANGERGFDYYALKDAAMSRRADCGLMIWDGKSKGTFLNVVRLVESGKPAVVYIATADECITVRTRHDLSALLNQCSATEGRRLSSLLSGHPRQASFVLRPVAARGRHLQHA